MKPIRYFSIILFIFIYFGKMNAQPIEPYFQTQEISIGYGIFPITPATLENSIFTKVEPAFNPYFSNENIIQSSLHYGKRIQTGGISLFYMHNTFSKFSFGTGISYYGSYQRLYNKLDGKHIKTDTHESYSIIGLARYNYVNNEWMRVYSQIGLGAGLYLTNNSSYRNNLEGRLHFTGQLTVLGLSVGKDIFGFTEIYGLGATGIFVAGIGYKF